MAQVREDVHELNYDVERILYRAVNEWKNAKYSRLLTWLKHPNLYVTNGEHGDRERLAALVKDVIITAPDIMAADEKREHIQNFLEVTIQGRRLTMGPIPVDPEYYEEETEDAPNNPRAASYLPPEDRKDPPTEPQE
jgi:hypothetical protein